MAEHDIGIELDRFEAEMMRAGAAVSGIVVGLLDEARKAGRIAALREVGCMAIWAGEGCAVRPITPDRYCRRCRLLAEAESGEQVREVGDDR